MRGLPKKTLAGAQVLRCPTGACDPCEKQLERGWEVSKKRDQAKWSGRLPGLPRACRGFLTTGRALQSQAGAGVGTKAPFAYVGKAPAAGVADFGCKALPHAVRHGCQGRWLHGFLTTGRDCLDLDPRPWGCMLVP